MATIPYPLINGHRCSWAEIEIRIAGLKQLAVKEISYKSSLEGADVYGTGPMPLGRTLGQAKFEASITLMKEEADELIMSLGPGYGEVWFDIVVQYRLLGGLSVSTDTIRGCRIKGEDHSFSQSADGLAVKYELHPVAVLRNGIAITKTGFDNDK